MKKIFSFILVVVLGTSAICAQSIFAGKKLDFGDSMKYLCDKNGIGIMEQTMNMGSGIMTFQMKCKDLSSKRVMHFITDPQTLKVISLEDRGVYAHRDGYMIVNGEKISKPAEIKKIIDTLEKQVKGVVESLEIKYPIAYIDDKVIIVPDANIASEMPRSITYKTINIVE